MEIRVQNFQNTHELWPCIRRVLGIMEKPQAEEKLQKRKCYTYAPPNKKGGKLCTYVIDRKPM
jgi:hypothetical protein